MHSLYWSITDQTTGSGLGPHRIDSINPVISDARVNPVFAPDDGDSALALVS